MSELYNLLLSGHPLTAVLLGLVFLCISSLSALHLLRISGKVFVVIVHECLHELRGIEQVLRDLLEEFRKGRDRH